MHGPAAARLWVRTFLSTAFLSAPNLISALQHSSGGAGSKQFTLPGAVAAATISGVTPCWSRRLKSANKSVFPSWSITAISSLASTSSTRACKFWCAAARCSTCEPPIVAPASRRLRTSRVNSVSGMDLSIPVRTRSKSSWSLPAGAGAAGGVRLVNSTASAAACAIMGDPGLQMQCGVNFFIPDPRRVLAPAPKVLGPKHIS